MSQNISAKVQRYDVLLFAIASELAQRDALTVEVETPVTAGDVLRAIGNACPLLLPWLPSCRLAVNQAFVSNDFVIVGDAEIALIPPVSGG